MVEQVGVFLNMSNTTHFIPPSTFVYPTGDAELDESTEDKYVPYHQFRHSADSSFCAACENAVWTIFTFEAKSTSLLRGRADANLTPVGCNNSARAYQDVASPDAVMR